MRRQLSVFAVLAMIGAAAAFAQSAPSANSSEGFELLKKVARQYADANSYYIESMEERTSSGEYDHTWQKTVLTAAEAPGNRSYYEGRSNAGSAIRVADGKSVWTYRADEHRYTVKPQLIATSSQSTITLPSEMAMMQARDLKKKWSHLANSLKSADRLPDALLTVNGQQVLCNVVRIRTSDFKRVGDGFALDETMWIDATRETVLKTIEHVHTNIVSGAARLPIQEEILTIFTTTFNGRLPTRSSCRTFPILGMTSERPT